MQQTTTIERQTNDAASARPLVTVVIPGYNEAAILHRNVGEIIDYLDTLADRYRFELLLINDGSSDETGKIAEQLSREFANVSVIHHPSNFGLGQAFKTAFAASRGDYLVTIDADLSYAPQTIGALLEAVTRKGTKLVLASAYMKGGKVSHVPPLRHWLSRLGNRMFALLIGNRHSTFTCMVRAYDGPFIRALEPKSEGMGIMPEIVYKTMILGGRIDEIPAHLDWSRQLADGPVRTSSMRLLSHIASTLVSGFVLRPFVLLVVPGLLVMMFSLYVNFWVAFELWGAMGRTGNAMAEAAALLFREHPATMLIGLLSLLLAIQLIGLGALSLQAKKYYEETYFQFVRLRRQVRELGASIDEGHDS
ncbi:MAG: glycosyltransferase family 2 protein [Burkholderiaceae bacterium]